MFRGVNAVTLDSKGRMAIPTRYREQLARVCSGQMVLTVDRDHCLLLYPQPEWEEIERKIMKLSSFNKQTRKLQRLLVATPPNANSTATAAFSWRRRCASSPP